jgi:hypothetical protein
MAELETVPIEDKGMLSDIMAERDDAPPEPIAEPAETPEPIADATGRLHGQDGKFVPKAKEPDAAPIQQQAPETPDTPQPTEDDKAAQVPSWRLREVREAREAAERKAEEAVRESYAVRQQLQDMQRRLAELQKPKQEPVDFFANPEAAIAQHISPIEERFAQLQSKLLLNSSRAMAVAIHGAAAVQEMEAAVEKATRENHQELSLLAAQMRASDDPVHVAMQWHKRTKLWETTGGDPDAYKKRVLEDAMKDPEFQAKVLAAARGQAEATPTARPNVQLPPSLNKATGAGLTNSDPSEEADMTDRGLFKYAMGNRR